MKSPGQIVATRMLEIMDVVPLDSDAVSFWTGQMLAAIETDRAQRAPAVVILRNGETFESDNVEVIDLDFLGMNAVTMRDDYEQDDIDRMVDTLRAAGFNSAAEDVESWWKEGE